jgi:hypothetical protein
MESKDSVAIREQQWKYSGKTRERERERRKDKWHDQNVDKNLMSRQSCLRLHYDFLHKSGAKIAGSESGI